MRDYGSSGAIDAECGVSARHIFACSAAASELCTAVHRALLNKGIITSVMSH